MQSSHSIKTIFRQIITGIVSLIIGLGIVRLFHILANNIELYWPDGSRHDFFLGTFVGYLGVIGLVVYLSKSQFEEPASSSGSFFVGITFGLGWMLLAVFGVVVFLMIPIISGDWPGFSIIISEIVYVIILFPLLGVIFGIIQAASQHIGGVDYTREENLVSNEASVEACKAGILPYFARVRNFWTVVAIVFVSLLLLPIPIVPLVQGERSPLLFSLLFVLVTASVFLLKKNIDVMRNPQIEYVEGLVTKSTFRIKYGTVYSLRCNGKGFTTNSQIWEQVSENGLYRLWYSATNKNVVAYERMG